LPVRNSAAAVMSRAIFLPSSRAGMTMDRSMFRFPVYEHPWSL
jgi:hypothetical protein